MQPHHQTRCPQAVANALLGLSRAMEPPGAKKPGQQPPQSANSTREWAFRFALAYVEAKSAEHRVTSGPPRPQPRPVPRQVPAPPPEPVRSEVVPTRAQLERRMVDQRTTWILRDLGYVIP